MDMTKQNGRYKGEYMQFSEFNKALQMNIAKMTKDTRHLFVADVDSEELWQFYLDAFPEGTNEIYKTRREFDCGCCRNFVKKFGNVCAVVDGKLVSIWGFAIADETFQTVIDTLNTLVLSRPINGVFVESSNKFGTARSLDGDKIWNHFYCEIPIRLANTHRNNVISVAAKYRENATMLLRALEEIKSDALQTVIELCEQNALYRGEQNLGLLREFQKLQVEYQKLPTLYAKSNFCWIKSVSIGEPMCRIRNSSIGTLLVSVSSGEDIDGAVRQYESIVAPENYRRPKPIFTQNMLENARKDLEKMGLIESLPRRFATEGDIGINDVLWVNRAVQPNLSGGSDVFKSLSTKATTKPKVFSGVQDVHIDEFMKLLPTLSKIQIYFDSKLGKNLVSLITSKNLDAKPLFSWGGNTSWAYIGNLTDSSRMKEAVKAAGGSVTGDLRFSISWEHQNDLDAHTIEPDGNRIYFRCKVSSYTRGELDVDIVRPVYGILSVENTTWANRRTMIPGKYIFSVHNYSHRGGQGFKAEIEFDGKIHSFEYKLPMSEKSEVIVATVELDRNYNFTIAPNLEMGLQSMEVWNIKSDNWYDVSLVTLSPNYWSEKSVGNKHYIFVMPDVKNTDRPNGFFNEYLPPELNQHRKVLEALAGEMRVEDSDNQLSGIGFSSTQHGEMKLKITAQQTERIINLVW